MEQVGIKVLLESEVDKALKNNQAFNTSLSSLATQAAITAKTFGTTAAAAEQVDKATKTLSRTSVNASGALTSFNRIVQDAPFGLIGVGNNITQFAEQFQSLRQQTGSAGSAFKALASSLTGAGGLTLGISAVISTVTSLTQKYGSLGNAYLVLSGQISYSQRVLQEYNNEIGKSLGNVKADISLVNGYLAVAKDENISRDQRNKALKEAKKLYPQYLDDISLETINSKKAAEAIDTLTQSLIRKAKIQGAQNIIAKEQEKIFEAQNKPLIEQATTVDVLTAVLKGGMFQQTAFSDAMVAGGKRQQESLKNSTAAIKQYEDIIKNLLKGEALDKVLGFGGSKSPENKVKTVSSVLDQLKKDLTGLDVAFVSIGGNVQSLAIDKLKRLERALADLGELGVKPGSAVFNMLNTQVEALQNALSKTPVLIKLPIKIEPVPAASSNVAANFKAMVDAFDFEGAKQRLSLALADLQNWLNNALKELTQQGVYALGEGIGNALSGGGIQSVFSSFANLIGGFLQEMGKQLIVYGTTLLAFNLALENLNPYIALAAGAAAIAAGQIFKNKASKMPSFATGGIANGPMAAILGDNPGRREAIVPSEDWREAFGGMRGGNGFIAETRIAGSDLLVLLKRAGMQQGRANG